MKSKDLCKWLRDNSSGAYRPSAEAADRIELLESALAYALKEADGWYDDAYGGILDGREINEARKLLET